MISRRGVTRCSAVSIIAGSPDSIAIADTDRDRLFEVDVRFVPRVAPIPKANVVAGRE